MRRETRDALCIPYALTLLTGNGEKKDQKRSCRETATGYVEGAVRTAPIFDNAIRFGLWLTGNRDATRYTTGFMLTLETVGGELGTVPRMQIHASSEESDMFAVWFDRAERIRLLKGGLDRLGFLHSCLLWRFLLMPVQRAV